MLALVDFEELKIALISHYIQLIYCYILYHLISIYNCLDTVKVIGGEHLKNNNIVTLYLRGFPNFLSLRALGFQIDC